MFIIWLRSPLAWGSSPMDVHTSKFSAVRPCSYLSSWFCVETQTGHVPFWFSPFVCTVLEMKLGQSFHLDVEVLLKSYLGAAPCPKNRFVSLGPEAGTFMPITWGTPQGEDFTTSLEKCPRQLQLELASPATGGLLSGSGARAQSTFVLWRLKQCSEPKSWRCWCVLNAETRHACGIIPAREPDPVLQTKAKSLYFDQIKTASRVLSLYSQLISGYGNP